jgi:hypothetical protein
MRHAFRAVAQILSALVLICPVVSAVAQVPMPPPRDGVRQIFHPTGKYLILEEYYKGGQKHGPSLSFNKNGLYMEQNYKEGKLDGFSRQFDQGNLVSEKFYKDGKPEGASFILRSDYKANGRYLNGKPDGVWTAEKVGRWKLVKTFKDGVPDGLWERTSSNGKEVLRLTYEKGKLMEKGDAISMLSYLQKVSALAKSGTDPVAECALKMLEADVDLDYPATPAKEVIEDLKERFQVPMYVDIQAKDMPRRMELPVTIDEQQVQVFVGLHEIASQNGLAFDYRFHSFWLTTPKAIENWQDTTGVSDLKPAAGSPLAKALLEPLKFDLLATPIAELSEPFQKELGVTLDATRVKDAEWIETGRRDHLREPRLSLRDALFITLQINKCRCREDGGKLIIEPLEIKKP